jgi:hypothetical protein
MNLEQHPTSKLKKLNSTRPKLQKTSPQNNKPRQKLHPTVSITLTNSPECSVHCLTTKQSTFSLSIPRKIHFPRILPIIPHFSFLFIVKNAERHFGLFFVCAIFDGAQKRAEKTSCFLHSPLVVFELAHGQQSAVKNYP